MKNKFRYHQTIIRIPKPFEISYDNRIMSTQSEIQIKNGFAAFVMINCKHGHEHEVSEQLRDMKVATEIFPTFGSYDILVKIESASVDHIRDIIAWKIRKMDKIHSTTILMRRNIPID
jgi:DNA-binding Lrp family transcriptional regulator